MAANNVQPHPQQQQQQQQPPQHPQQKPGAAPPGSGIENTIRTLIEQHVKSIRERRKKVKEELSKTHPDSTHIRKIKPMFKEWLEIRSSMVGRQPNPGSSELIARSKTLLGFIEQTGSGSEHFNGFKNWLKERVTETIAKLEGKAPLSAGSHSTGGGSASHSGTASHPGTSPQPGAASHSGAPSQPAAATHSGPAPPPPPKPQAKPQVCPCPFSNNKKL